MVGSCRGFILEVTGFGQVGQHVKLAGIDGGVEGEFALVGEVYAVVAGVDFEFGLTIAIALAAETFDSHHPNLLFHVDGEVMGIGRL